MTQSTKYLLVAVSALLSACSQNVPQPDDPAYAPVVPERFEFPEPSNGSIYQSASAVSLFTDTKASRLGDILTVVLQESTNASKTAETSITKDNTTNITNPTILGQAPQFNAPGLVPLATNAGATLGFNLSSESDFEGESESDQSNSLQGDISVTVVDVYPNGNLLIRGEKWLSLNQGEEYIRLTGIVRPQDIGLDNSIQSTRIANARIAYGGTGATADSNRIGWLAKFFVSAWPF